MKKVICLILSVITLIGILPMGIYAEERPFPDVPANAWYTETIIKAHELGIIQGDEKGNMMPAKPITRAEAVAMIRNHCNEVRDYSNVEDIPFTDVSKDAWYYEAVKWAYCEEIIQGTGNNKFKPDDYITRQDFAVIIYRFYNNAYFNMYSYSVFEFDYTSGGSYKYKDRENISEYALYAVDHLSSYPYIYYTEGMGTDFEGDPILQGSNGYFNTLKPCSRFNPLKPCSRSEAAQILVNVLDSQVLNFVLEDYIKNYGNLD